MCHIVDFCCSSRRQRNLKESEKQNKYLDLAKELKGLFLKATAVLIAFGALETVPNSIRKKKKKKAGEIANREKEDHRHSDISKKKSNKSENTGEAAAEELIYDIT